MSAGYYRRISLTSSEPLYLINSLGTSNKIKSRLAIYLPGFSNLLDSLSQFQFKILIDCYICFMMKPM